MTVSPGHLFAVIWIGWFASWMLAALWSSRTQKRATTWEVLRYRALILIGAALLWTAARTSLDRRIWNVGVGGAYALAGVTLAGIAFTWWARIHLGRLWSGAITRKEGHRVVDTGPYALVRHPIYAGLIAALVATGIALGTAAALGGAALAVYGLWLKARAEERFLIAELGPDYDSYRRRIPMLVPFLRRASGSGDQ